MGSQEGHLRALLRQHILRKRILLCDEALQKPLNVRSPIQKALPLPVVNAQPLSRRFLPMPRHCRQRRNDAPEVELCGLADEVPDLRLAIALEVLLLDFTTIRTEGGRETVLEDARLNGAVVEDCRIGATQRAGVDAPLDCFDEVAALGLSPLVRACGAALHLSPSRR